MKFAKMQATGNDFLFVEAEGDERDWPALSIAMCERHFGVGADGLILVMPSQQADVRMRLFNADGSEAEVSGNGVRCLVKYVVDRGIAAAARERVTVEAVHGILEAEVIRDGTTVSASRLSMGVPRFAPQEVPVIAEREPPVLDFPLDLDGEEVRVNCMSIGNPHAVLFTDLRVTEYPLERIGPKVEHHPAFPARVNFGVAQVLDRGRMDVRVWERGVGETLACGSGCCGAMVMAHLHGFVDDRVDITQPGGHLIVEWDGKGEVYLTGAAEFIFEGDWPG